MEKEYRWSHSGTKMQKGTWGWKPIEETALACFICPSLIEVFKTFGNNIMKLRARGGKQIDKDAEKIKEYGMKLTSLKDNSCVINYDKFYNQKIKCDDLTEDNIAEIWTYINKLGIQDCSVEYLLVKVEDDYLKQLIEEKFVRKLKTNTFFLEFHLTKCENEVDRNEWDNVDYNSDTLTKLGFKKSLLHCNKMYEEWQFLTEKKKTYFIHWDTNDSSEKTSDEEITSAMMKNLEPHGLVKKYETDKQNKLVLKSMNK